ncbi:MAG: aspartyl protease family protein [Bacteroidota bacterium]
MKLVFLKKLLTFIFLLALCAGFAQKNSRFSFQNEKQRSDKINVKLVNNLMAIPLELNGTELWFVLDSGVDKTLLFSPGKPDSTLVASADKVKVRGLGSNETITAYKTQQNRLKIGDAENINQEVYVIFDDEFDLSDKVGFAIHGVIGYDFLKDFVVRINYNRKQIKFYNPNRFGRKLRLFEAIPIQFYKNKPYVEVELKDESLRKKCFTLLVDTGSTDALWLFENETIQIPEHSFNDIIGYGLAALIRGKRSKLTELKIGKFQIESPQVAYPNDLIFNSHSFWKERDGTLGSGILSRFKIFIDYQNRLLYLKPNADFDDTFNYDMSGLVLIYSGYQVVERYKEVKLSVNENYVRTDNSSQRKNSFQVSLEVKPQLTVDHIRLNSPAAKAGMQRGDVILKINNRQAHALTLDKIKSILSEQEGKMVKLEIKRNDSIQDIDFRLESRLNSNTKKPSKSTEK